MATAASSRSNAATSRSTRSGERVESVRFGLLRLHAGAGAVEGITRNLSKAGEIASDIERLLEGQEEVDRALRLTPV